MSDDAVRKALASLARGGGADKVNDETSSVGRNHTFRETIERATTATSDFEAAATFVEDGGLDDLERAIEQAERSLSACAENGQRALDAFREFQEAAEGGHFHPGHGTSLGGGDIAPSK